MRSSSQSQNWNKMPETQKIDNTISLKEILSKGSEEYGRAEAKMDLCYKERKTLGVFDSVNLKNALNTYYVATLYLSPVFYAEINGRVLSHGINLRKKTMNRLYHALDDSYKQILKYAALLPYGLMIPPEELATTKIEHRYLRRNVGFTKKH